MLIVALGYGGYVVYQLTQSQSLGRADGGRIRQIVASEELILELNAELGKLSRSAKNLQLPDYQSRPLFQPTLNVSNVTASGESHDLADSGSLAAQIRYWTVADAGSLSADKLDLWQPLFGKIAYWDHAKFYFIRGEFPDDTLTTFHADVGFKGLAKQSDGLWAGVKGKLKLKWVAQSQQVTASSDNPSAEEQSVIEEDANKKWTIAEWQTVELKTIESPELLFTETLASALPDPSDLKQAQNSLHEEVVRKYYRGGAKQTPWPYFSPISANQRPGISIVDVDQDGFDDIYVMVRKGRNQLLHNQGNGTFTEVASKWGLDIEDYSSCGIFADFDNDGDPDLLLGRSVAPSLYLRNNGQRFEPVTEQESVLPKLVVSMSAADYNADGLLDVYVSTYRPAVLESLIADEAKPAKKSEKAGSPDGEETGGLEAVGQHSKRWTEEFLSPKEAAEYERHIDEASKQRDRWGKILDQTGPPNVLLVNRGGRFEVAPESPQLALWRNTLQATWADFDDDGDPDLYVANDWARDNLLQNNGDQGFIDVTSELSTTEFGFAMGATWGDYDLDGKQDLYVSNMFSKAGRRITSQIAELNPNFQRSVVGNYLYRNTNEGFDLVSGLEKPKLLVAEAGWSWGGQFSDFDNDGYLDLYVLSGYFTAPDEFASDVDL